MVEKRKLPARAGREPASKRREPPTPASSHKKKAHRAPSQPHEPLEAPLPTKLQDGAPIPVTRQQQSTDLPNKEYLSITESAVILASLERSKKSWVSDGILVRYYTKPKKARRDVIEKLNPPKDSMTKVGPCDITIGPHLFDAIIFTVKDPSVPQPLQYAPPQRPMVHYGHPNNFQQYQPYPGNQQRRPPYPPTNQGRPQSGYQGSGSPIPRGPHQQSPQRPPQSQNGAAKPGPDPVIQMLATRAAADPELKALMRVVAGSLATQEQLRAFQAHIDELNAIIKAREQQERRQQSSSATPSATPSTSLPSQPVPVKQQTGNSTQSQDSKSQADSSSKNPSNDKTEIKQESAGNPVPNTPASTISQQKSPAVIPSQPLLQSTPKSGPAVAYQQPPLQSRPQLVCGSPAPVYRTVGHSSTTSRQAYKAVVFEFTSPLTPYGNSASGHAGSGDRYLLPEHTILEWLQDENVILASFLVVRMVDPSLPFPIKPVTDVSKAKAAPKKKKTKAEKEKEASTNPPAVDSKPDVNPPPTPTETPITPSEPPVKAVKLKEYWQPVTFRIHATDHRFLEPLTHVVKPADEVRKYMNDVMDRAERAPDGFPALRLPREESRAMFDVEGTPTSSTSAAASRQRPSRGALKTFEEESEVEGSPVENPFFYEIDDEELKESYDAPMGLPPIRG